ncbi:helix-turn-helix transcriptional regulator [Amycolatopsis nigrescens]|uniref:helix-turn-helix transcriptional regulator n=1 Tax=Amycolatopsis nigrescens TaxID=381445 RepID=UPI000360D443|nr:helix-turn-helix domain-containing protein [Amycolatopsis nigrescens]
MKAKITYFTVEEFMAMYKVARSTWDDWRAKRTAPPCIKLPNGQLRIPSDELERWTESLEEAA